MAHQPAAAAVAYGVNGHGLRFLNEDWNDSISNGNPFTLTWNQSLLKAGAELALFKVAYPADGVVVYDLVANLTDAMNSTSCVWTPEALENELYAIWLTNGQHVHPNWTISPPWTPKEPNFTESDGGIKSKSSLWLITRPPERQDITTSEVREDEEMTAAPVGGGNRSTTQSPV
ncbi:uncharacterized protein MAM_02194 [Metarhizium album ARSEF 1941]|uniref:Uncharacterized protein n=1 Tax=Metarhizium album (strain ARSEF 1941) TaxID=1081103 RepID=A0A0B2X4R9_METAS|nr:uncharacterized protein MAM_02194 [Metarhizium album ARSEF 1941]KHO00271.1 hypothetical protein MAM_02194 [Metarhizium album ARSEF 1941]